MRLKFISLNKLNINLNCLYKSFALSLSLLALLSVLKLKLLMGYPFILYKISKHTENYIPEYLNYLNPIFYIDDLLVAIILFVIGYLFLKNDDWKINGSIYFVYLASCIISLISSFVFYKYETPINLATLSQIDSIYTMRTSIDSELRENYRLIVYFFGLLLFSIISPVVLYHSLLKVMKKINLIDIIFRKSVAIYCIIIFISAYILKVSYFDSDILLETPLTTISKSSFKKIKFKKSVNNRSIPVFDDRIDTIILSKNTKPKTDIIKKFRNKYNVILIILETTNFKFFSPEGQFIQYFPNFMEFSKKGIYFENFFCPFPRSSKSFFAIITGHYPLTSYKSVIKIAPQIKLPSLTEVLKSNGYSTFGGYSGDFNYDRMADFLKFRGVDKLVDIFHNDGKYQKISWCVDDEFIYDQLINWIDTLDSKAPFFGFLLPMNSHHPFWTPKREFKILSESNKENRYINAIYYQDYLVGKLFNYLKGSNKLDDTIVIITGDHGIVFNMLDNRDRNRSPYLLDKSSVKVPFYIYTPFMDSIKVDNKIIGNLIDIMPTILDILGIKAAVKPQGRSIFDTGIEERITYYYSDYYRHTVTGLTENFYLMRDNSEDYTILSKNLDFQNNYCSENQELCEMLKAKVDIFDKYQNQRLESYKSSLSRCRAGI